MDNVIAFGYGTISVGSAYYRLILRHIKPPQEVGCRIDADSVEFIGDPIYIDFTEYEEFCVFRNRLKEIESHNGGSFEFAGYIFDFTNYNKGSIDVLKQHLDVAEYLCQLALAC